MNSSCADILLFSAYKWNVSRPSLLADTKYDLYSFVIFNRLTNVFFSQGYYGQHNYSKILDRCPTPLG